MKVKGNIRAVDELGRVVIPIDYRKALGLEAGAIVDISMEQNSIVVKKLTNTCIFCGSEELLTTFKGNTVCAKCIKEISKVID